ncbi:alpha/beta fold hydrolase [Amycolatopsis sp. FDAARGOS 1241]|uniref:alpha/beta fold hydrolase n=1 Tax=Amycolatopsis sp. FDAARGOS 1241 TaxID=2778070 RepID=UPI00194F552B|nr:alpha/beta hydrolase [Amycolatopsis sp. FDAARGOS 1241]QRP43181.1 alpha/beta hydrolase [Amycolatopsis sp. FDAARGOS 1241]
MATIVLVHGSWHDGSLWEPVASVLRGRGHEVHTPTVAGHGPGVPKDVTHDDCVHSIVNAIAAADLHDVVLLGHSFGGTVIARVAEEIPERLKRLIFWNAFVPKPGNCLDDEVPPHYREMFARSAAASDDNSVALPFPVWREAFIQDADAELAASTYEQLSTEPYQPFLDKLDLTRFYAGDLPKSYINATEDTALPPGEWGWHPRMSSRLGLYRLVQLPGSHEVMFTAPERLATAIEEAARD